MKNLLEVHNEDELKEILKEQASKKIKKVVLKFYSDNCPPCALLDQSISQYEPEEDIVIVKINATVAEDLKVEYGIKSVPWCFIVDVEGKVLESRKGYMKKDTFETWINEFYFSNDDGVASAGKENGVDEKKEEPKTDNKDKE